MTARWRFGILLGMLAGCGGRATEPGEGPDIYVPGRSYFGTSQYIEYIAGDLPVIFTAAHGGSLTPAEIPDRQAVACGGTATTVRDTNTEELAREMITAFRARTGKTPHVIINRLHRRKLDANRDLPEAACGDAEAEQAWREFHKFVVDARNRALAQYGKGWYTDLHGHGHAVLRLELGYLLSAANLRMSDAVLNTAALENESSVRTFSADSPLSFAALLRGPQSLGSLFAAEGFRSVPSPADQAPTATEEYFSGGYNTERHGCSSGGNICGVQIESHFEGVRDNAASRAAFAAALFRVYDTYLSQFGIQLE